MTGHPVVRVAGTGSFLPATSMDNRELYAMASIREGFDVERARASLSKSDGAGEEAALAALSPEEVFDRWARQVTGIRERRVLEAGSGITTEQMCARAARRALDMAGLGAGDLDLVVVGSVTPADVVPNAACTVAELLGEPTIGGFTLNGACAGFVHALAAAFGLIRCGAARRALAISGDSLSRITDYSDPTTAVLFADGAGAAVLVGEQDADRGAVLGAPCLAGEYAREHLFIRGQGWEEPDEPRPKLHMGGGPRVLRRAIRAMAAVAERSLDSAGLTWDDVDWIVPHQANLRITEGLEKHLSLPRGRVVHNIRGHGNSSASTVGIALDELIRGKHGPVPDPARIVLTAVGGGYTMGALTLEWRGGPASETP